MNILETRRRDLVAGPLVAMAAMALGVKLGKAAGVDPTMTIVTRPDEIPWKPLYNFPPGMAESANMFGDIHAPGQYFVLIRWHPGYMSAPHWYETDRLCVVMSGTWYVASGEDFAPDATVPVPAGSFVHRVAKTPHYDGVKKGATESAIIAISGIGPITYHLTDPTKPGWSDPWVTGSPSPSGDGFHGRVELLKLAAREALLSFRIVEHPEWKHRCDRACLVEARDLRG